MTSPDTTTDAPGPACGAGCLVRQLIVPDELLVADSGEERERAWRYQLAVLRVALTQPDNRMVVERCRAVATLLAAAGREGAA